DRRHHTQHAVVLPRVAHGVEMRTEHQAWPATLGRLVAADAIADRIEARLHAGLAHPAEDEIVDCALLGGQENARQSIRLLGVTRERLAAIVNASSVDHGRKLSDGGIAACASR